MTAIVTNRLKKDLLESVYNEIVNLTDNYYVAVGRTEQWDSSDTVPDPRNSLRDERNFRLSMQSIKKITDVSYVIPRYNWSTGTIYNSWDDDLAGLPVNSYYVLTEDNQVYVCLQSGKNAQGTVVASTVKPTGSSTRPIKTSDGYVWKFLYGLTGANSSKFLSANFLPVQYVNDSSGSPAINAAQAQQASVQEAASKGQILSILVTDGGTGFTSTPTVNIRGDGVGASATAFVSGGSIVKIDLDSSSDSTMTMGHSYNFADITLTGGGGGTGFAGRVIIGPDSGIGANAVKDLRSTSLLFNIKPAGDENEDWLINDQDYRQVGLIKNPKNNNSPDSDYTAVTGRALRYLLLTSPSDATTFTRDVTITGTNSGAKAIIDDIDSDRLYAHQSEATGFLPFNEGEPITGGGASGTLVSEGSDADSDAFYDDDVDRFSGDLLYLENRAAVARTAEQTEDIKVIITL